MSNDRNRVFAVVTSTKNNNVTTIAPKLKRCRMVDLTPLIHEHDSLSDDDTSTVAIDDLSIINACSMNDLIDIYKCRGDSDFRFRITTMVRINRCTGKMFLSDDLSRFKSPDEIHYSSMVEYIVERRPFTECQEYLKYLYSKAPNTLRLLLGASVRKSPLFCVRDIHDIDYGKLKLLLDYGLCPDLIETVTHRSLLQMLVLNYLYLHESNVRTATIDIDKTRTTGNAKNSRIMPDLEIASSTKKCLELIVHIINLNADISHVDFEGKTVIHYVAQRIGIISRFPPHAPTGSATAYFHSSYAFVMFDLQTLLKMLVGVDDSMAVEKMIKMHRSSELLEDLTDAVDETNANRIINVRDKYRMTALHYLVYGNVPVILHMMLSHGADLRATDRIGATPFHLAVQSKNTRIVHTLASHDYGIIDVRDVCGRTPLYISAVFENAKTFRYLINRGANITMPCRMYEIQEETSPIHRALNNNVVSTLGLLYQISVNKSPEIEI